MFIFIYTLYFVFSLSYIIPYDDLVKCLTNQASKGNRPSMDTGSYPGASYVKILNDNCFHWYDGQICLYNPYPYEFYEKPQNDGQKIHNIYNRERGKCLKKHG